MGGQETPPTDQLPGARSWLQFVCPTTTRTSNDSYYTHIPNCGFYCFFVVWVHDLGSDRNCVLLFFFCFDVFDGFFSGELKGICFFGRDGEWDFSSTGWELGTGNGIGNGGAVRKAAGIFAWIGCILAGLGMMMMGPREKLAGLSS